MPTYIWIIILIVACVGIAYIEKKIDTKINDSQIKKSHYRYYAKPYIMTARENECFKTLNEIFGAKWFVIPQVHLSALLNHKTIRLNKNGLSDCIEDIMEFIDIRNAEIESGINLENFWKGIPVKISIIEED